VSETVSVLGSNSVRYMSAGEAAEYLHVSPKTIARWANERRIPCLVTLGGHRRFLRDDIETVFRKMSPPAAP
jgi:excisionase family DNA binding protein